MEYNMKTFLSYITYYLGHWVSKPMIRFDWGFLYGLYSKLMTWSYNLDTKKKVWRPTKDK